MKKKIASLLVVGMIFSAFTGCGSNGATEQTSDMVSNVVNTESAEKNTIEEAQKKQPVIHDEARIDKTPTIEETTLVDQDGVKITATSLEYSDYSVDLNIKIENSTDNDITVYSNTIFTGANYVNDFAISDGYLSCDVPAGETADDVMSFEADSLLLYGISKVAKFNLNFNVEQDLSSSIEDSDYDEKYSDSEDILYSDCELVTSIGDSFEFSPDAYHEAIQNRAGLIGYEVVYFSDEPAFEYDTFNVESQCIIKKDDGYIALVEVYNKYQEPINVSVNDIYLNDIGVYSGVWNGENLLANKHCILSIDLSSVINDAAQEAYGINDVKTLSLTINVTDAGNNPLIDDIEIPINIDDSATVDLSGSELYNEDGIRIIDKGLAGPSSEYDSSFYWLLEIENTSDKEIHISVDDYDNELTINGISTDGYGDCESKGHDVTAFIVDFPYVKDNMNLNSIDDITSIVACIELEYEEDTNTITLNYNK